MTILERDELFTRIYNNQDEYKIYLEQSTEFDKKFHDNFPKDDSLSERKEYLKKYEEELLALEETRKRLDSEWEVLKKELYKMIGIQQ